MAQRRILVVQGRKKFAQGRILVAHGNMKVAKERILVPGGRILRNISCVAGRYNSWFWGKRL